MFATNFVYCVFVAYYPSPPVFSAVGIPKILGYAKYYVDITYLPIWKTRKIWKQRISFVADVCTLQTLFIASVAYPSHK